VRKVLVAVTARCVSAAAALPKQVHLVGSEAQALPIGGVVALAMGDVASFEERALGFAPRPLYGAPSAGAVRTALGTLLSRGGSNRA